MVSAVETVATKDKIVEAAAELLARGGREAVSTRAVAAAAGVQAPTIYRHFDDMKALLGAVAAHGFATYMRDKTSRTPHEDPVAELREGWDQHVAFGLEHPGFYTLMYGDPQPGAASAAASQASSTLSALMGRVAETGRLRVSVDQAVQMIHAAACGVTLTLLESSAEKRDLTLSALSREAVLSAVTLPAKMAVSEPEDGSGRVISYAVALKTLLPEVTVLTGGEQALLSEWLDRLSQPAP